MRRPIMFLVLIASFGTSFALTTAVLEEAPVTLVTDSVTNVAPMATVSARAQFAPIILPGGTSMVTYSNPPDWWQYGTGVVYPWTTATRSGHVVAGPDGIAHFERIP